jgi:hypothetical protein
MYPHNTDKYVHGPGCRSLAAGLSQLLALYMSPATSAGENRVVGASAGLDWRLCGCFRDCGLWGWS